MSTEETDFLLADTVRLRVIGSSEDAAVVERQLGPLRVRTEGSPDVVVRFDADPADTTFTRFLGRDESGYTDDEFLVLRSKGKDRTRLTIPFADVGGPIELRATSGTGPVRFLIHILAVTALEKGLVPIHAGAFEWDGVGMLVVGWSKGGKTEAMLAATARGARYVGDEWCWVDPSTKSVLGIPEPVTLWRWHLAEDDALRKLVPRQDRIRMALLDAPDALHRRVPDRFEPPPVRRVLNKIGWHSRTRANAWVPPTRLFGDDARPSRIELDRVILVTSASGDEVRVDRVDSREIASRMAQSVRFELQPMMEQYTMFKFAFPDRRSPALEALDETLRSAMQQAFESVDGYEIVHPYLVSFEAFADALRRVRDRDVEGDLR